MILLQSINNFPEKLRGGAVAIGNFDGVHLGHARLIARLKEMARRIGGPSVVFTFDPPPTRVLHPEVAPEPLLWLERKAEILEDMGVDAVLAYPTDRALMQMDAREFFDCIVRDRLAARGLVEGPNFYFGHDRSGDVDVLHRFCAEAGLAFEVTQPVEIGGQIVSSSRIREAIMVGRVEEAAAMLGRPYRICGEVVHGAGRGATIGYPTANVDQIPTLMPAQGIYAARALADYIWYPAAVSLGPNPTFAEGGLKTEVYIIGFSGDLYGQLIEVDFLAKLREIRRFESVPTLIEQMGRDVARAIDIAQCTGC